MKNENRVLPVTTDPDTAPFWAAAREERLVIKYCEECDRPIHLPRAYCPVCRRRSDVWRDASGSGRVYSWTIVEHQVHPGYPTPYTSVLVELADHRSVRLLGSLPGRVPLVGGEPVQVWFEHLENVTIPQWRLVEAGGA
ncbi:Zn-ribbon domain-containing OB-fold protein [Gordonia humi]|uniref:DUF35 domain-containing protein n=1 Tax=Gordonia humi TaxID=686429 RepID=A0A840EN69_9ACTN|nr:OB-fold domain-containing protein [Gordonia humi]MBB4134245.1 hypothetical protein [Gordonia humi]